MSFEQVSEELRNAVECCRTFSEFTYEALPRSADIEFKVDHSYPAYRFDSGKSYFRAFRLDPDMHQLSLTLRSRPVWIGREKPLQFFFKPALLLLNDRFESVKLLEIGLTDYVEHEALPFLEGKTEIDPAQTPYMILLTTDKLRSFKTVHASDANLMVMPVPAGGGMMFIPVDSSAPDSIYFHSEVGVLRIMVR